MSLLYLIELAGTAVFAISGALAGIRYRMDIGGVVLVGFIVGNGGGTVRDIMLGCGSVFWMNDRSFIAAAVIPALFTFIVIKYALKSKIGESAGQDRREFLTNLIVIADALGLGVFAGVGCQNAADKGFDLIIAVMMGTITCTGGGIIRDMLCNEIPLVFCREIYLTAALAGAILFVSCLYCGLGFSTAIILCALLTTTIRLVSYYRKWHLPNIT